MERLIDVLGFASQLLTLVVCYAAGRTFGGAARHLLIAVAAAAATFVLQFAVVGGGAAMVLLPPVIGLIGYGLSRFGASVGVSNQKSGVRPAVPPEAP